MWNFVKLKKILKNHTFYCFYLDNNPRKLYNTLSESTIRQSVELFMKQWGSIDSPSPILSAWTQNLSFLLAICQDYQLPEKKLLKGPIQTLNQMAKFLYLVQEQKRSLKGKEGFPQMIFAEIKLNLSLKANLRTPCSIILPKRTQSAWHSLKSATEK